MRLALAPALEPHDLTPWQQIGDLWLKRDDLFEFAGVRGGKVRTCLALAEEAMAAGAPGLIAVGARQSSQVNRVAQIARELEMPCCAYVPARAMPPEMLAAERAGCEMRPQRPGYMSVLMSRARAFAAESGWSLIPFGAESQEAVDSCRAQARGMPGIRRLVICVGSGMTLSGVLWALREEERELPILALLIEADSEARLDRWAPPGWRRMVELLPAGRSFATRGESSIYDIPLDPHFEGKCVQHLRSGDGLWIVGTPAIYPEAPTEGES